MRLRAVLKSYEHAVIAFKLDTGAIRLCNRGSCYDMISGSFVFEDFHASTFNTKYDRIDGSHP